MISTFRHHWPALVLAFLVGFFLVLPPLWAKFRLGIDFNDPMNIRVNDEFFYLARIREVIDGHPLIGNPYFVEHKSKPPAPTFLGEYIMAQVINFFGLDVVSGNVLFDFLLPPIAVILTYAILLAVTSKRWLSLFGSSLLFFGFFPGDFGRAISPQLNFLFWLSQFLLLWLLAAGELSVRARRFLIAAAALNFGLLFYIYAYYWAFYLAFFGIAFLLSLLTRARDFAKAAAAIALGGLVMAIPYFWLMARALSLPEYGETIRRMGMIDSHFPSGIAIILPAFFLLVATAVFLAKGFISWDRRLLFFVSGALAAAASVNQHVITGKNLEFSSHYYMLSVFWLTFFASYLASIFLAEKLNWDKWAAILAFAVAVGIVGFAARDSIPPQLLIQRGNLRRFFPLFEWLDRNTRKDAVVYAAPIISDLIPIYTANNVFFSSWGRLYFASDEEILDRFILSAYQESFDPSSAVRTVFGAQYVNAALHTAQENKARRLIGLDLKPVIMAPEEATERIIAHAQKRAAGDFYEALKRYRVDYFVLEGEGESTAKFSGLDFLEPSAKVGGLVIYRVKVK